MKCWELRWLLAPLPFSRSLAALSALPPLIQGEQLMALVPLSCQWSRARLCACSVGFFFFFHWEEARGVVPPSLPPLLSPPLSCLTPSGEGKSFGASARSDRGGCQAGRRVEREFDWFLLCCCRRCSGLPKGPTATFFFITFIILV